MLVTSVYEVAIFICMCVYRKAQPIPAQLCDSIGRLIDGEEITPTRLRATYTCYPPYNPPPIMTRKPKHQPWLQLGTHRHQVNSILPYSVRNPSTTHRTQNAEPSTQHPAPSTQHKPVKPYSTAFSFSSSLNIPSQLSSSHPLDPNLDLQIMHPI